MGGVLEGIVAAATIGIARAITGVRGEWRGCAPELRQRIYFANHASHGDFVLIWTVLPPPLRRRMRPVAGADYWMRGAIRRYLVARVFNAVLIERDAAKRVIDPVEQMADAVAGGDSILLFPEGTRNLTDAALLPFKSGLFHLAAKQPGVDLVPVWIQNLNRVLPKGEVVPIPLLCTVTFGTPLRIGDGESKDAFLTRASQALLALAPPRT